MFDATFDTLVNPIPEFDEPDLEPIETAAPDEATRMADAADLAAGAELSDWAVEPEGRAAQLHDDAPPTWSEPMELGGKEQTGQAEQDDLEDLRSRVRRPSARSSFDPAELEQVRRIAAEAEAAAHAEAVQAAEQFAREAMQAAESAMAEAAHDTHLEDEPPLPVPADDARPAPISGAFRAAMPPAPDCDPDDEPVQLDHALFSQPAGHRKPAPQSLLSRRPSYTPQGIPAQRADAGRAAQQIPAQQPPAELIDDGLTEADPVLPEDVYRQARDPRWRENPWEREAGALPAPLERPPEHTPDPEGNRWHARAMSPELADPALITHTPLPWFVRENAVPQTAPKKRSSNQRFPEPMIATLETIPPEQQASPHTHASVGQQAGDATGQPQGIASVDLRPGGFIGWVRRLVKP